MSQKERDRLKVLTEAKDGLITQEQAAGQLQLTQRQVRRLIRRLRQVGDRAVLHGLRGRSSNRKIDAELHLYGIRRSTNKVARDFCAR